MQVIAISSSYIECATAGTVTSDLECIMPTLSECQSDHPTESTEATVFPLADFQSCSKNSAGKSEIVTARGNSGIVTSPGFPNHYLDQVDCLIKINVSSGCQAKLTFCNFDLEQDSDPNESGCPNDYLEVSTNVDETDGTKRVGKFCGPFIPSHFLSWNNEFTLHFWTDFSTTYGGFKAYYNAECPTKESPTLGTVETRKSITGNFCEVKSKPGS
jgi:hypothetical protein